MPRLVQQRLFRDSSQSRGRARHQISSSASVLQSAHTKNSSEPDTTEYGLRSDQRHASTFGTATHYRGQAFQIVESSFLRNTSSEQSEDVITQRDDLSSAKQRPSEMIQEAQGELPLVLIGSTAMTEKIKALKL